MEYEEEINFLDKYESKTEVNRKVVLSEKRLKEIRNLYPSLPQEYFDYLSEIGYGTLREIQFYVHQEPFRLDELELDEVYPLDDNIIFFGDNRCGDFAGFDLKNSSSSVVELWHESGELFDTQQSFREYMREVMLMGENGEDLRT